MDSPLSIPLCKGRGSGALRGSEAYDTRGKRANKVHHAFFPVLFIPILLPTYYRGSIPYSRSHQRPYGPTYH
ncbi:hypothetical protein LY76DRAFT_596004 [Colletotrichum caudatum]|nr:hypothetical protein LY76DRAFT_596004 [Colletotrichum caudatum]